MSTQWLLNSNQRFGTAVVVPEQLFLYIVKSKLFTVSPNLGSTYSSVLTLHPSPLTPHFSLLSPPSSPSHLTSHAPVTPHPSFLTPLPSPLTLLPSLLTLTPHFSNTPHSSLLTPLPSPLPPHPHTLLLMHPHSSPLSSLTYYLGPSLLDEHRPSMTPHQRTLYLAALAIPPQLFPCSLSSSSVSRLQLLRDRPLFLFPCGFQVRAWHVILDAGFLRMCPILSPPSSPLSAIILMHPHSSSLTPYSSSSPLT